MNVMNINNVKKIITAGSTYLDIDAYACIVAMTELLRLKGENVIAYSEAPCNYSVVDMLVTEGDILTNIPVGYEYADYIIVDVSDPEFLKSSVPIDRVIEIYDHHVGFEDYWYSKIGKCAHIEFIGAAATLIYREWEKSGLQNKIIRSTALLLIAAILDNTLNLTSSNTTDEDMRVFIELCRHADVDKTWCDIYFSEVQKNIEKDFENALFKDIKTVFGNSILPPRVAQLCVWDGKSVLEKISEIRRLFENIKDSWMINVIDIKGYCSYFICDGPDYQRKIEDVFCVSFNDGVAKTKVPYLRKEIIKITHQC